MEGGEVERMTGIYQHQAGTLSLGGVLDVGLKCVHSCRFCYYSFLDGQDQFGGMRKASFRSVEECKEILRLLKQQGLIHFDVTGGEPTLHPEIVELMRYAHRELGLAGRIITLGQFLLKKMPGCSHDRLIDGLLEAGLVNFLFSLHAVDEELFQKTTGGSFHRLEEAMNDLDERNFQYTSNTTVFEWNYRHLPDIARRVLRHGIYLHNFIVMNAYYHWNQGGRAFGVQARYADIRPYLEEAIAILEEGGVAVNVRYAPLCTLRGLEKHLVGVLGVRYDPYEWRNFGGHMGGNPAQCAQLIPMDEKGVEVGFEARMVDVCPENGVRITGVRGQNRKHYAEPCLQCTARLVCDGIDPAYLQAHGPDEFVPYLDAVELAPLQRARLNYSAPFQVKVRQDADMKAVLVPPSSNPWGEGLSPAELPNRRGFNILLLEPEDEGFASILRTYLEAFDEADEVALHVLSQESESCQERILALLEEWKIDAEHIPDISILESDPVALPSYLKAGDLAMGSPSFTDGAQALGIPFLQEPSRDDLLDVFRRGR